MVIQSRRGPYRVRFGPTFAGLEQGLSVQEHFLIDSRVADLYAAPLARALASRSVLRIEATESNKSLEHLPGFAMQLIENGIARTHVLIVVGGGVLQDIGAFLAGTLLRGVAWRFHPTTLLAQADSCIGSKSSINVGGYKNMLGTYTPPDEVWIAPEVLDTLSEVDIRSGIGEIIKTHVIAGWEDVRALAADYPRLSRDRALLIRYVRRALAIKQGIIEVDEFDRRERLVLNYGHTFGHALESATGYAVPHGIAVTIGMDLANFLSWQWGHLERAAFEELHGLLVRNAVGFLPVEVPEERFFDALAHDKKASAGALRVVLLRGPGKVFLEGCPYDERLREACRVYFAAGQGADAAARAARGGA